MKSFAPPFQWLERRYPCRTWDPEAAAGFYVPFYSGIAHMYNYELRGCNKRPFCEDPPDGPPCDCKNSDYPGIPRLAANDMLAVLKKQPYLERWVCVTMRSKPCKAQA